MLLTKLRSPICPRSTRISVPSARARSAAVGWRRSRPRSRAKWFLVPAGTRRKGRSRSAATPATSAMDPSPPATPRRSAPSSAACLASSRRLLPGSIVTTVAPARCACLARSSRAAFPRPERGLRNSTGWAGRAARGWWRRWSASAQRVNEAETTAPAPRIRSSCHSPATPVSAVITPAEEAAVTTPLAIRGVPRVVTAHHRNVVAMSPRTSEVASGLHWAHRMCAEKTRLTASTARAPADASRCPRLGPGPGPVPVTGPSGAPRPVAPRGRRSRQA